MKLPIRIWLLSPLLLSVYGVADEVPPLTNKSYRVPSVRQRAEAAQKRFGVKPVKIELPSLDSQVESAKAVRDLDNPLYTGRVDYPMPTESEAIAGLHQKYEPEFAEAWRWWTKLVTREYLPTDSGTALSALVGQQNQDDLIGARYRVRDMSIQIVDGRSITMVVSPQDRSRYLVPVFEIRHPNSAMWKIPKGYYFDENLDLVKDEKPQVMEEVAPNYATFTEQEKLEQYVHAVARQLMRFDHLNEDKLVTTKLETRHYSPEGGGYGVFLIDKGETRRWFLDGTITWWSDGTTVFFDVRKLTQPPVSKFGIHANHELARKNAFGLPFEDERKFERFSGTTIDFTQVFESYYRDNRIMRYSPLRKINPAFPSIDRKAENKTAPAN